MNNSKVIIIGGGLAGLTAAIHLSMHDIGVVLLEKEEYPHHKVCGEYLSVEVLPYLNLLGVDLHSLDPAEIRRLIYSSSKGRITSCELKMGGLGISRYTLDHYLFKKVLANNCRVINSSVSEVEYRNDRFLVKTNDGELLEGDFVLGAFGKRSKLDKKLERSFINNNSEWLAVKSHYLNESFPGDLVALHNFNGGYCGISRTESEHINVCYLASYNSFKKFKDPNAFKEEVLMQNPELKAFFQNSEPAFERELSIAQISFGPKKLIEDHVIMIGDAAGLIHPLCGNGMAMAIHSAKIAAENILEFYRNKHISRSYVEYKYRQVWNQNFNSRIKAGKVLQKILLNKTLAGMSQSIISNIPGIMPHIVKRTHGELLYV